MGNSSTGRPHVIFKRSAVDKVAAYHRTKRAVDNNKNPYNINNRLTYKEQEQRRYEARRQRESKEAKDKRRRQYLEDRRRRLEALRRNPTEYRRQQWKLRMEQRRRTYPSASKSSSSSIEAKSEANRSREKLYQSKNKNRKASNEQNSSKIRNQKKSHRRKRNCATKQPPYQWRTKNVMNENIEKRNDRRNKIVTVSSIDHIPTKLGRYEHGLIVGCRKISLVSPITSYKTLGALSLCQPTFSSLYLDTELNYS